MRSPGVWRRISSSRLEIIYIKGENISVVCFSSCSFGKKCEFVELNNLLHGFLLNGDRSVETVAVTARLVMKQTADFLDKFVNINNLQSQLE